MAFSSMTCTSQKHYLSYHLRIKMIYLVYLYVSYQEELAKTSGVTLLDRQTRATYRVLIHEESQGLTYHLPPFRLQSTGGETKDDVSATSSGERFVLREWDVHCRRGAPPCGSRNVVHPSCVFCHSYYPGLSKAGSQGGHGSPSTQTQFFSLHFGGKYLGKRKSRASQARRVQSLSSESHTHLSPWRKSHDMATEPQGTDGADVFVELGRSSVLCLICPR